MADDYLTRGTSTRRTPQSEPIPGSKQVENTAGGYVFAVDDWTRLERWLILGSEGGTYYVDERSLTIDNADCVLRCIKADGLRTVETIKAVSLAGRAPKNDQAIFALAMASKKGDEVTRRAANDAVADVCRTGTMLFHFGTYVKMFGGWSKATSRAVNRFYKQPVKKVAYQAVKYRQRDGWTHADLLRLSHPKPETAAQDALYKWIVDRDELVADFAAEGRDLESDPDGELDIIVGFEKAQKAATPAESAKLVSDYNLPREAVLTEHLNSPEVWESLLAAGMPMTALIRNLPTMTRIGLLAPNSAALIAVLDRLADSEALRAARVHPMSVLMALRTYESGHSFRGSSFWTPVAQVVDALDEAFYEAFNAIEPTGKRHLLAIDVSNSMRSPVNGAPMIQACEAAGAMAMVCARTEVNYETVAFAGADCSRGQSWTSTLDARFGRGESGFTPMTVTPKMRLDSVMSEYGNLFHYGSTDCALPMLYASALEREVDTFVVYTDNETWAGDIHPMQALQQYRRDSGIDAKLIVVAMTSTGFSIADPEDGGAMDVVGFDTAAPTVMADFTRE